MPTHATEGAHASKVHDSPLPIIVGTVMTKMWRDYVKFVLNGSDGRDGQIRLKERFWLTLLFEAGADFECSDADLDSSIHPVFLHKMFSNEKSVLGDSYGYRIHRSYGVDQFAGMLRRAHEKPESKAIFANLLHPLEAAIEQQDGMNMEKTACLASLQVLNRDGCVDLTAHFRSQNAWRSHGNFVALNQWHAHFVSKLASEYNLVLKKGRLVVQVTAAHLYEPDWQHAEAMVRADHGSSWNH